MLRFPAKDGEPLSYRIDRLLKRNSDLTGSYQPIRLIAVTLFLLVTSVVILIGYAYPKALPLAGVFVALLAIVKSLRD
jgi:hypothetical protein